MRAIRPYKTVQGARRALDNGGRFYNLLTKADDAVIDGAELARAAGATSASSQAFIHFEMALMALRPEERAEVVSLLSPELAARYQRNRPMVLAPSSVEEQGDEGAPAVVTGYPVFVEDKTQFTGMIILVVPVIMMIPIMDQYDVYEVYDTAELTGHKTTIATTRGSKRLDGILTRFGGMLKDITFEDKTGKGHSLYLDAAYYTPLQEAR